MNRALVTGASGFVGANLVRRLVADGHQVHLAMRPGFKTWRLADILDEVDVRIVDLTDRQELDALLASVRPEWIFHLAAHGAYPSETDLASMVRTNVVATTTLVSAALAIGFDALVNTGSSSEYGPKDHAPTESESLEPNSDYAVTKASATLYCRYAGQRSGTNITTLRLYSVYGPWEEPSRLVPTLVVRGLEGRLPALASPTIARDFVYVDDVIDAYLLAAQHADPIPGAVYNIATGVQTTLREIVELARKQLRIDAQPDWGSMADRSWDTSVWVGDAQRARDALGWHAGTPLIDGLRRSVDWMRADDARRQLYARVAMDA